MIDWIAKIKELKAKAEELDLWASRTKGREKLIMGRIADELRVFAAEIEQVLKEPDSPFAHMDIPDWLLEESQEDDTLDNELHVLDSQEDDADYYEEDEWWDDDADDTLLYDEDYG